MSDEELKILKDVIKKELYRNLGKIDFSKGLIVSLSEDGTDIKIDNVPEECSPGSNYLFH